MLSRVPHFSFTASIDKVLVICYLLLLVAGWLSIAGASGSFEASSLYEAGSRPFKQMIWILLATGLVVFILFLDKNTFDSLAPVIYGLVILLMITTLFLAPDIKGSRSWLVLGPIRLQSAEFAKVATALMLASVFNRFGFRLGHAKSYITVFAIILIPMLFIILQKEAGSALVFCAFFLALYREGLSGYLLSFAFLTIVIFIAMLYTSDAMWLHTRADYFVGASIVSVSTIILFATLIRKKHRYHVKRMLITVAVAYVGSFVLSFFYPVDYSYTAIALLLGIMLYTAILAVLFLSRRYLYALIFALVALIFTLSVSVVYEKVLKPHQQERIAVALGIKQDYRGAGYNVNQAKIAIGSGGLTGKGFMKGTQTKLNYVPEQDTDFIFCTIGEEYGFLGSTLLLLIYLVLILRLLYLSERQKSTFARVYGYCVTAIFFFHIAINVGMVLGLVPVIGIPLPLLSYGGSSLWGFTILLFIFIKLDASRKQTRLERTAASAWNLRTKVEN